MTNEHIANIAITVTAAMLATAAVAFTLSGNAPVDPRAGDLPIVSVEAASAKAAAVIGQTLPTAKVFPRTIAESGPDAATAPHAASVTPKKPSAGSSAAASGGSPAPTKTGAAAASSTPGSDVTAPPHPPEQDADAEHEVVVPEVHESDEDEDTPDPEHSSTTHER